VFHKFNNEIAMPKSYSVDLRERVLKHLEKNPDKKAASVLFQVGIATIFRWVSRKKLKGNVEPLRRKYAYKKIDDQKLIEYVENHPDHFLSEIGEYFGLTLQTIFYALKRLKITRKKKPHSTRREMKKKEPTLQKV
jgi:transposase